MPEIPRYEQFHWGEINLFRRFRDRDLFNDHTLWFAYGRQALRHGLKILGISAGDKVLVPDYICNVIESAFLALKIEISYYAVQEDLTPDFEDINKKIDSRTKALLAVNYYGLPAPIEAIKTFCAAHRLFYIEDNAQGFFGKKNDQRLGTFGDIGFTSVRKSIPMIHGAILNINPELGVPIIPPAQREFKVLKSSTKYFIYYMMQYLLNSKLPPFSQIRRHQRKKKMTLWENAIQEQPDRFLDIRLNSVVPVLVTFLNYQKMIENKRKKYERILTFLKEQSLFAGEIFTKDFLPEMVPFQIPFLVRDKKIDKGELLTVLNQNGVEAFYWPDLPHTVVDDPDLYPAANYLKNNLIHFPV
ncbi:MAG: DegT/DnrJ/EryC1/StrS family aminotransferase [Thermodesulfobacteriota bacterium]